MTAVDSTLGRVTLAIGGAIVEAEFRPAVLTDVKPGDDVMVTVELIDTRVGAVTGAVTAVDPASGVVTVSTPGGPWTNTFLPGAVAGIKPGDQAVLKLDLLDLGPRSYRHPCRRRDSPIQGEAEQPGELDDPVTDPRKAPSSRTVFQPAITEIAGGEALDAEPHRADPVAHQGDTS